VREKQIVGVAVRSHPMTWWGLNGVSAGPLREITRHIELQW